MAITSTVRRVFLGLALAAALIVLADVDRAAADQSAARSRPRLIGIKIYDYAGDFAALFKEWRALGINTAFVSPALEARPGFREQARQNGLATFLILPIFYNVEALEKQPDLAAVTQDGKAAVDDWVKFVCPSRPDYRLRMIDSVIDLVRALDPDGISLDFIRHFVFWEMVYPDRTLESLPNSCFCPNCLEAFQEAGGVKIPSNLKATPDIARWILAGHRSAWTDWKCGLITGMVKELVSEARKVKPGIKVNIHAVPWRADDFSGAIRIVAGQDLAAMSASSDYVSPMCYHHMVRQIPSWVHSVVEDVSRRVRVPVLPSIQVKEAYIPDTLSAAEFEEALIEALKPPSAGVVFWSWDTLSQDPAKQAVVRSLCRVPAAGAEPVR